MLAPEPPMLAPAPPTLRRLLVALFSLGCVALVGCASDAVDAATEAEQATLADLNLDPGLDAGPLSGDLDPAEEQSIRESLATEFASELGVSAAEAKCLSETVEVSDLLEAGSAPNGGDGTAALERVLQGFDDCNVARSVFAQDGPDLDDDPDDNPDDDLE